MVVLYYMNKLFCYLAIIITLVSCTNNTTNDYKKEKLLKKEFKNYVELNFDNPDNFEEIVEIIPYDTLSTQSVTELAQTALNFCQDVLSKERELREEVSKLNLEIDSLMKRISPNAFSQTERTRVRSIIAEELSWLSNKLEYMDNIMYLSNTVQTRLDSLQHFVPLYGYAIKYRIKENNDLVLKTHYGYIDSLDNFHYIKEDIISIKDYNKKAQELVSKSVELSEALSKFVEKIVYYYEINVEKRNIWRKKEK